MAKHDDDKNNDINFSVPEVSRCWQKWPNIMTVTWNSLLKPHEGANHSGPQPSPEQHTWEFWVPSGVVGTASRDTESVCTKPCITGTIQKSSLESCKGKIASEHCDQLTRDGLLICTSYSTQCSFKEKLYKGSLGVKLTTCHWGCFSHSHL